MSERGVRNREVSADRLPPYSDEAEAGVVACAMLDPNTVLAECAMKFGKAGSEVFYNLKHRVIYDGLKELWESKGGTAIDLITLQTWLADRGQLEQAGGLAFLMSLPDLVPSAANLPQYIEIVWDKWLLRCAVKVATETVSRIYEQSGVNAGTLLDQMEAEVLAINQGRACAGGEARGMKELVMSTNDLIDNLDRGVGIVGGIRTYFGYLDKMTGGLHKKELAVLAARPSVGKTSLALNIAVNAASRDKVPTAVFSMEMSSDDLTLRMRCAESKVNFHKLRTGFPSGDDYKRLGESMAKVASWPIWIDETSALGILELRARARRLVRLHGVQLIVIDYLQLMHGLPKDYSGARAQEVADISGGLKSMAKELDAAVLVLSQLNREVEKSKNRKPQLADLRESGAIEQDADMVMMLYRPKSLDDDEEDSPTMRVNALIAKQRNGPTGDVELLFRKELMQFQDAYFNQGHK